MSRFYGQVDGQSQTRGTRMGSSLSGIRASAQSYRGSVIVYMEDLRYDLEELDITIQVSDDSSFYGTPMFHGTLDELKMCFNMWNATYGESQPQVDCEEIVDEL